VGGPFHFSRTASKAGRLKAYASVSCCSNLMHGFEANKVNSDGTLQLTQRSMSKAKLTLLNERAHSILLP